MVSYVAQKNIDELYQISVGNAECVIAIYSSDLFKGKLFRFSFENSENLELKIFFYRITR